MSVIVLADWVQPLLLLAALVLSGYLYNARKHLPFPPGPRPLPLIGNILDMPTRNLGENCRELNVKYGDIVYLNVFGQPMVILGSHQAVNHLLEVRSSISSDRLPSPMAEMTGFMWDFALEGYTSRWRAQRRVFHQLFYPNAIKSYRPQQLREVQRMLQRLVATPEHDFVRHIRHYFGASIMGIVYGLQIADNDDKYLVMARKALLVFIEFMVPGRYMVESLHFLRHIPSWFPGAGFKRKALAWRRDVLAMRDVPFDAVVENMANGTARPCIVTSLLAKQPQTSPEAAAEHEELLKDVAALAYITGADTTFSSVVAFFLAMTIYTDVQKKAQAELDAVVGPNRLPDFDDRPSLPYVNALVKECMRWHIVLPLGIPHRTIADEVYQGYLIPKGTALIPNAWALSRDPEMYPEPEEFKPERFLDPKVKDPMGFVFGSGRRICAGRHFADASLFIIVASVLHTLDIEPPLDKSGAPVKVDARMSKDMLLSYPEPFDCRIKARSPQAQALIHAQGLYEDE